MVNSSPLLRSPVSCDRARLRRVHEYDEAINEVVDVLERARLQAVAIDSHWQVLGHVPGTHATGMGFAYPDPYLTNPYPVPVRVLPTRGNP